jgi:hypothetical protein
MKDVYVTWRTVSVYGMLVVCSYITAGQTARHAANTTICKIAAKPSEYVDKLIRIRALYAGSFEGAYLVDPTCQKSVWFTTPEGMAKNTAIIAVQGQPPKTAEPSFELVKDEEYDKFEKLAYATTENLLPEYEVTAMFTGRLDHCKDFKVNKNGFGNGFGQMGQSEFKFVLQSVSESKVKEAEGVLAPTRSTISDHIPAKQ